MEILKDDLTKRFETEKYLKNSMHSLLSKSGLLKEYYENFRYEYAWSNPLEFSQTTMYDEYMTQLKKEDREKFMHLLEQQRSSNEAN